MKYTIGDKIEAKINKIQDNGCFCSLKHSQQFGFMPNNLMPSLFDNDGKFVKSVGDNVMVVIDKINSKGFILLSDIESYNKKKEKAINKQRLEAFVAEYEPGTIFEAVVSQIETYRILIKIGDVEGIIKKEDTNWNDISKLNDLFFEGEVVHAVYLKNENGHLFFSLKLLNDKPYDESLYDLSLFDLLKYLGHDSNVFVGQAKQYSYGLFIENLYSISEGQRGKLLIDPVYGYNLRAIVSNANYSVEDNKFYKIELKLIQRDKRLKRNQLFQFVATNIEEAENPYKADVNLTFAKSTSPRDCAALAHTLAEVGKNMYSSKDRMFFELVQNADDAAAQKGVYINVASQDDYLIVCHNGNSFDKDDFDAITSSANGTKKANENKTGYKGIGFKSVFTDSEIVYIKTGGYQFKFDKTYPLFKDFESFYYFVNGFNTEQQKSIFVQKFNSELSKFRGVADIPWQLEPIWVDNFPKELGEDFTQSNVAIALKLGKSKIIGENGYDKAIADIIANPHFMLFLRNTKRIDYNGFSVSKTTNNGVVTLKNSFGTNRIEYFKREDFEIEVNNEVFEKSGFDIRIVVEEQDKASGKIFEAKFVDKHNQELENIPKKIAINSSTGISFAILIDEDGTLRPNTKRNEISLFAFLPTLVKDFKFPFYINANFVLDPPRQRILGDNIWNFYLMEAIARQLVRWSASLNEKKDKNALNVLLPIYFEEDEDTKLLASHFNTAYKSAIESESFILNYKGTLSKQDEIIIDKTGLSKIVGTELFCLLLNTEKYLPSEYIDSHILEEDIFENVESLGFDNVIYAIINNEEFNEWFIEATSAQKTAIYKWVDDNNTKAHKNELILFVDSLPLFIFGENFKSSVEIEASDYIISTKRIISIKETLSKLGIVCSDNVIDESHPLYEFIGFWDDEDLFNAIKDCDFSNLSNEERKKIFFALVDFDGVGEAKLKAISLFKNMNGDFKPLAEMISYEENVAEWLYPYVISKDDDDIEFSKYLIPKENEFKSIIQEHYEDMDVTLAELYNSYKGEWPSSFTRHIINSCNIDNEILTIIEESDTETKKYFLNSIKKLELHSSITYRKESYEYRVLQLVLSIYEEPSEFSQKIYFDENCIKDFSVLDEVICDFVQNGEKKKIKMSLAKLLPQYQTESDSIEKIKALFESKKDLDKFFVAKPKSIHDIHQELNQLLGIPEAYFSEWNVVGNAQQYLFAAYYRRHEKNWNNLYVPKIVLGKETKSFVDELLDFLYDNKISIPESPFTYHLKTYFIGKYFNSDYLFESEQLLTTIEQWADDDKKVKYLIDNGVRTSSCNVIQFRKLLLENKPINFIDKISDIDLSSSIDFISTDSGYVRPFVGVNQKNVLLQLRNNKYYKLSDNWNGKKIKEYSREWHSKEYSEWIEEHNLHIFIYPGALPRQFLYENVILLNYDDTEFNYFYDRLEKRLYLSGNLSIEEVLFEVAKKKSSDFNFDDYKILCLDGKVPVTLKDLANKEDKIRTLTEDNIRKDKIIEQYRKKYGELFSEGLENNSNENIPKIVDVGFGDILEPENTRGQQVKIQKGNGSSLAKSTQFEAQIEAQKFLMQEELAWHFPTHYGEYEEDGKPYYFSTAELEDSNDNPILIVLKSYKKQDEPFKLNPEELDWIFKKSAYLLIYTGVDIKRIEKEDLIRNQSSISISFSTENLNIEERIVELCDVLHYFKELHFDFKSFNLSENAESIRNIFKRNEGSQNNNTEEDL